MSLAEYVAVAGPALLVGLGAGFSVGVWYATRVAVREMRKMIQGEP